MACRSQSWLWMCLVIGICVRSVISEEVELICDKYHHFCTVFKDCVSKCTVRWLYVSQNQHVIIPNWQSSKTVRIMKIFESSLYFIPQPIFSAFENLEELDISSSKIVELTWNTFSMANKLLSLNLSHNNIIETPGAVFQGANNLSEIDISYNHISKLSEYTFNGMESLKTVNMAYNQIRLIEINIFSDNGFLEIVNLEENQIDHLDVGVFSNLKFLEEVNLAGNKLTVLDPNLFDFYISFSTDVSRNRFTNLTTFTSTSNLRKLSVAHNKIGKINITTLAKLPNLEILNLKNTSISGLTFGTFSQQRKLAVLDLSDNNLNHLNLDIFLPYMSDCLEELYLDGNSLSTIEGHHSFASFSSLKKLGLRGNKFNCSYLLQLISSNFQPKIIEFNSDGKQMPDDGEHIYGIECSQTHGEENASEEHLMLQHLIIIKYFAIFTALLGLCFVACKGVKIFVNWRRNCKENIIYS